MCFKCVWAEFTVRLKCFYCVLGAFEERLRCVGCVGGLLDTRLRVRDDILHEGEGLWFSAVTCSCHCAFGDE